MSIRKKDLDERFGITSRRGEFWERRSVEELARLQGTGPVESIEDLMGGWPPEEVDDGFEEAVLRWRRSECLGEP
ncbi:MAG TPA: hypothetical protein VE685_03820 [Thermoanaerobaculia bacterium]|nr:hypothetical protein [Thermoanaerobaculia bacterium]